MKKGNEKTRKIKIGKRNFNILRNLSGNVLYNILKVLSKVKG
jgi:hypothetical protein